MSYHRRNLRRAVRRQQSIRSMMEGPMPWKLDRFEPSDGTKVCGIVVDHRASIRREGGDGDPVSILIAVSARGVGQDEASCLVATIISALNAVEVNYR